VAVRGGEREPDWAGERRWAGCRVWAARKKKEKGEGVGWAEKRWGENRKALHFYTRVKQIQFKLKFKEFKFKLNNKQ